MHLGVVLIAVILSLASCNELQECNAREEEVDNESCGVIKKPCKPFNPEDASVIISDSGGRLGNQMFVFLLLTSLKLKYDVQVYMTRRTFEILGPIFEDLNMEVAEDVLCELDVVYPKYL